VLDERALAGVRGAPWLVRVVRPAPVVRWASAGTPNAPEAEPGHRPLDLVQTSKAGDLGTLGLTLKGIRDHTT
jgi:hypothetical protein